VISQLRVKGSGPCAFLTGDNAMKTYWGRWGTALRIFDFGTRWRWVVSFTPRPLYSQGKGPWYSLDRRLGWPQGRSGRGGEKNSQPRRDSNHDHLIFQQLLFMSLYMLSSVWLRLREILFAAAPFQQVGW